MRVSTVSVEGPVSKEEVSEHASSYDYDMSIQQFPAPTIPLWLWEELASVNKDNYERTITGTIHALLSTT